jgi:HTH-type transcriptional regulator/antitoxin HigA
MTRIVDNPICSEAGYNVALKEIEHYFENELKPGTPEADRFDFLATIIDDYERRCWPIKPADTNGAR